MAKGIALYLLLFLYIFKIPHLSSNYTKESIFIVNYFRKRWTKRKNVVLYLLPTERSVSKLKERI